MRPRWLDAGARRVHPECIALLPVAVAVLAACVAMAGLVWVGQHGLPGVPLEQLRAR